MRPWTLPTRRACFGTRHPSAANARRNPASLNAPATDHVNGVATPGRASPTFTLLQTVSSPPPSGKPRPVAGRAWTIHILHGVARELHVPRAALELLEAARDPGELRDVPAGERGDIGRRDVDLLDSPVAHDGGLRLVSDERIDDGPGASMRRTSGVAMPLTTGAPSPRPTLMMRSSLPRARPARA